MAKKTVTKQKLEEVTQDIQENPSEVAFSYKLTLDFNGNKVSIDTNDLNQAIISSKPFSLKTRLVVTIEKDNKVCERVLYGFMAKQLFRNDMYRRIFLNRLIFK